MMAKSIISNDKECYVCHTMQNLHKHHIYEGTANRKKSDKYGCWIWLCGKHHNLSNKGIHFNKNLDNYVKVETQKKLEEMYGHEWFMETFGKNYL